MAIGTPQPSIGPINPASLIGQSNPVEPRAVSALADAFRQGVITSEDILQRSGEVGRARKKAELQSLTEQTSPEAIQARAAQRQLAGAQASAALPLVEPTAELQQKQLAAQIAYQKYPAAKVFDQYAPVLGIEEPMAPDGQVDWSKKASIGIQIAEHIRLQTEAKEKLENITTQKSPDGSVISAFTKQGIPVDTAEVQRLESQARNPFRALTPGAVAAPAAAPAQPTAAPAQPSLAAANAIPNLAERDRQLSAMLPGATPTAPAAPVVEPKAPAALPEVAPATKPTAPPMGTPVAGGFSLGPPSAKESTVKAPTEAQQRAQLAISRFAQSNDMLDALQVAGFNPSTTTSWIEGMLPEILKPENRKMYDAATSAWAQGLLRLESGAAISPKEQRWYEKSFFPQPGDTAVVQTAKEAMRKDVERMVAEIAQAGSVQSPETQAQQARIFSEVRDLRKRAEGLGGGTLGTSGGAVKLSTGRTLVRDANGTYRLVQ